MPRVTIVSLYKGSKTRTVINVPGLGKARLVVAGHVSPRVVSIRLKTFMPLGVAKDASPRGLSELRRVQALFLRVEPSLENR